MRLRKTVILGMLCISLLGVTACGKDKDAAAGTTESGETNATQEIVQEETISEEMTTEEAPTQSSTEAVSTQAPTQKPTQAPTQKPTQAPTTAPTPNPKELLIKEKWYHDIDDSEVAMHFDNDGSAFLVWIGTGLQEGTYTLTDEEIIYTDTYSDVGIIVFTMTADGNIVVKSKSGLGLMPDFNVGDVFFLEK